MIRQTTFTLIFLVLLGTSQSFSQTKKSTIYIHSVANQWLDIALEATANEVDRVGAKPTIQSRTLGLAVTAMYDAWAAYDAKAVSTCMGGKLRRPLAERTLKNKETAISYAVYRVLNDIYP